MGEEISEELFGGVEDAEFAGVVKRNIGVSTFFAEVDFTGVEGLGIHMDADGALVEFGQVEDLVDRFQGIDVGGMGGVHFVKVGGKETASAAIRTGGVVVLDAEILDFEAANRSGHPTVLIAVIVNAAELPDFPADGHALEHVVLENEIAGVIALGPEKIFLDGLRTDLMGDDEILDGIEGEIAFGNGGEFLDPVGDVKLRGSDRIGHESLKQNYSGEKRATKRERNGDNSDRV